MLGVCPSSWIHVLEHFGGTYESAKSDGRKKISRMLKCVQQKANHISCIIVLSPDRFSRTDGEAIALNEKLRSLGVAVEFVTQQTDTSDDGTVGSKFWLLNKPRR
ncbi:recombinase family protein [Hymenobacter sp. 15J16-1T3B]|uniref:recombinase family protein n=1 Tax=Hymenobacter sp. 15J16-1T3B TaxID=2886941 RepID=UPI001D102292|nr:recombinase family protein [Hymenobacter sp. 15J16-1T3B]